MGHTGKDQMCPNILSGLSIGCDVWSLHMAHSSPNPWWVTPSRQFSQQLPRHGRSCLGQLQGFKGTRAYISRWSQAYRHIESYGCFKGAWQCYTSVLSCLYCFYFPSLRITQPVENQPNRIPCLKIQGAMDDVGFAYTWSSPCEIFLPCL